MQVQVQGLGKTYRGGVREDGIWQLRLLAEQAPAPDAAPAAPTIEDGYMVLMEGGQPG